MARYTIRGDTRFPANWFHTYTRSDGPVLEHRHGGRSVALRFELGWRAWEALTR